MAIPTHNFGITIRDATTGIIKSGSLVELKRGAVTEVLTELGTSAFYVGTGISAGGYRVWVDSVDTGHDYVVGGGELEAQGYSDEETPVSTSSSFDLKTDTQLKTILELENVANVTIPTPLVADAGKFIIVDSSGDYVLETVALTPQSLSNVSLYSTTTALQTFTLKAGTKVIFEDESNVNIITLDEDSNNITIGTGPTLQAWISSYDIIQIGTGGALVSSNAFTTANAVQILTNIFLDSSGTAKYINSSDEACRIATSNGTTTITTCPSGTAGDPITEEVAFTVSRTEVIINDNKDGIDFRVESDSNTHALFVDADTGNIGIGGASSGNHLEVIGSGQQIIRITSTDSNICALQMGDTADGDICSIFYTNSSDSLTFRTNASDRVTINSSGHIGIGLTPTANMVGLSVEAGVITLKETTTPTADTGYGKIYTKTDNKLYVQTGDGVEHEIAFV